MACIFFGQHNVIGTVM